MNALLSPARAGRLSLLALAVVAAAALAGCQKRSTTVQTPNGTVTTTTLEPTAEARQQLGEAAAAASTALSRAGAAASEAFGKAREASADAADRVRESASSGALARVGEAAADSAITAKVKAALLADQEVKGLQIDVDTHDGAVTLTGAAESQPNLDRAAAIARKIDGVKSVQNRIAPKKSG